jgi:hypothetical protein
MWDITLELPFAISICSVENVNLSLSFVMVVCIFDISELHWCFSMHILSILWCLTCSYMVVETCFSIINWPNLYKYKHDYHRLFTCRRNSTYYFSLGILSLFNFWLDQISTRLSFLVLCQQHIYVWHKWLFGC